MEDESIECEACCGKGWNEVWKRVDGHFEGGEYFREECEKCEGSGKESGKDPEALHAAESIAIYTAATGKTEAQWCRESPEEWGLWLATAIAAMPAKG
jgi:DnaJ-class molecular chaperone